MANSQTVDGVNCVIQTNGAAGVNLLNRAVTNTLNGTTRLGLVTSAANTPAPGVAGTNLQFYVNTNAGTTRGGFFFVCRFITASLAATSRLFIGLNSSTIFNSSASEPSSFLNKIGLACDSTDANLNFAASGAATTGKVNLGVAKTAVASYEFRMFSQIALASPVIYYSLFNLNTNAAVTQGSYNVTANITTSVMTPMVYIQAANAAPTELGFVNLYCESNL
jgi:hypothetical protein